MEKFLSSLCVSNDGLARLDSCCVWVGGVRDVLVPTVFTPRSSLFTCPPKIGQTSIFVRILALQLAWINPPAPPTPYDQDINRCSFTWFAVFQSNKLSLKKKTIRTLENICIRYCTYTKKIVVRAKRLFLFAMPSGFRKITKTRIAKLGRWHCVSKPFVW